MNSRLTSLVQVLSPREHRVWENVSDMSGPQVTGLNKNAMAQREHRQLKALLRQLTEMHSEELPKLSLLSALQEAHLLKEKGLYDHALSILQRTYRKAMDSQHWHIAGEASEEMRQILSRRGQTDAVRQNLAETTGLLDVLRAEYEAAEMAQSVFSEASLTGESGQHLDMQRKAEELLRSGEGSLKVTYHACSTLAMMASARGDHRQRMDLYSDACRYVEERTELQYSRPDIYASILNNLSNTYQELGEYHRMPDVIGKLRALALKVPMQQVTDRIMFFAIRQETDLLLYRPDPALAERTEAEARQMATRWEQTIHPSNMIELCVSLATIFLRFDQTRKCLFWLNRLDSLTGRKLRRDMQCASLCLRLMTYVQSGELELALSLTRTRTYRKLLPHDPALRELRDFLKARISRRSGIVTLSERTGSGYVLESWIDIREWMEMLSEGQGMRTSGSAL